MNLIYFVENTREIPVNRKRSKKEPFFTWVKSEEGSKWRWLAPFDDVITDHDNRFLAAEFHQESVLRDEVLNRTLDPDTLFGEMKCFSNGMWENIISVMGGRGPRYAWPIPTSSH